MSSGKHRGAAYRPYAFTEHGALLRLSTAAGEDKNIFRIKFRADRRDRPISPTRTGTLRCRIGTLRLPSLVIFDINSVVPKKSIARRGPQLETLIYEIRGQRVMLDSDLAKIYGVETKSLNRAVKRNTDRFPNDFVFQISSHEWENLKCQIGTSSLEHGGRRRPPYAFTEHGAIMAANVLNSPRAVQMSVFVVRAFLKMRALLGDKRDLAQKLASLEKELKKRLDVHEAVIVTILQRVMDIIDPPALPAPPPKPRIGFNP